MHELIILTTNDLPKSLSRWVGAYDVAEMISIDAVDVRVDGIGGVVFSALPGVVR